MDWLKIHDRVGAVYLRIVVFFVHNIMYNLWPLNLRYCDKSKSF